MATVLIGDTHFRDEVPFHEAGIRFIEWFENQECNTKGNTLIHLGDLTHNSVLNGRVVRLSINRFFENLKFDKIYILQGNHDVDNRTKTSVLEPLKDNSAIKVIDTPCVQRIEENDFLCLPHLMKGMKEAYLNVYEYLGIKPDVNRYVIGHVADETQTLFGKYTDLSYLKDGKRFFGHVHRFDGNYLGTPFKHRYDEKNNQNKIAILNGRDISYIDVPKILEYISVEYGEEVKYDCKVPYLDVVNAPDMDSAYTMYGSFPIRKISLKETKGTLFEMSESKTDEKTVMDYFNEFSVDRELDDFSATKITDKLSKVG